MTATGPGCEVPCLSCCRDVVLTQPITSHQFLIDQSHQTNAAPPPRQSLGVKFRASPTLGTRVTRVGGFSRDLEGRMREAEASGLMVPGQLLYRRVLYCMCRMCIYMCACTDGFIVFFCVFWFLSAVDQKYLNLSWMDYVLNSLTVPAPVLWGLGWCCSMFLLILCCSWMPGVRVWIYSAIPEVHLRSSSYWSRHNR